MNWLDKLLLKYGFAAVVVLCVVGLTCYGCGRRYAGQLQERAKRQAETVKDLGKQADSVRTVYVHDTVTAYRYLTEWEQITDTLRLSDTVAIAQAAPRLLLKADSTIRACGRALHDCDQLQALEHARADSALALAETYRKLGREPLVSFYGEALHSLAGGNVIAGGAVLGRRLALTARVEGDAVIGGSVRAYLGVRYTF